jgi:glycerol uptake facilitator-like aquaporin
MNAFVTETLGSLVFFIVMLRTEYPSVIAIGLFIGIIIAQLASDAHLNPAVTLVKYIQGKMNLQNSIMYIIAQLLAAVLAVNIVAYADKKKLKL